MISLDGIKSSDHALCDEVFTPEATAFVADLVRTFRDQRIDLLRNRRIRQEKFDAGLSAQTCGLCTRLSQLNPELQQ